MVLNFNSVFKISGRDMARSFDHAALLLKDYLMAGTKLEFGKSNAQWFWRLTLPHHDKVRIPSEVSILTANLDGKYLDPVIYKKWHALQDRIPVKGAHPFNRTISAVNDLPFESLFAKHTTDFIVHIELPKLEHDLIPGFKDSATKLFIRCSDKEICDRLGQWFDARTLPLDNRQLLDTTFYAGFSELHYIFRVPVYNDSLLPQLLQVPTNVVSYIHTHTEVLQRGLLIAGLPGSGKTTTLKKILQGSMVSTELKSMMLADVKGEYEEFCSENKVRYLAPGRTPSCLRELKVNPFIPADNLRLTSHIDSMAVLLAIGSAGGGGVLLPAYMKLLLEEYYTSLLWHKIAKDDWPDNNLERKLRLLNLTGKELNERLGRNTACFDFANYGFIHFWKNNSAIFIRRVFGDAGRSNGRAEIEDVIGSRISFFETSVLQFFCYENGSSIDKLLNEKLCLSLQGFSKPTLQLLMSVFTNLCFEAILAGREQHGLKHIFVLEEAHLLAAQPSNTNEVLTVDRLIAETIERGLTEGRSKGMGIILTDQQPGTRLMSSVLANTNMKICHNLLGKDSQLMTEAMGLPNDTDFSCLSVGEAYVKLSDNIPGFRTRILR